MSTLQRKLLCLLAAAVTMTAAACGSSGKVNTGSGGSGTGAPDGPTTSVSVDIAQTASGGSQAVTEASKLPANMDDWEKLWATQRAAIVKRIKDNHWGVSADGKTLTGPEGFTVDLSACASGWSETEGLTDTTIKIGQTLPQSGTAAYGAYYGKGAEALFNHYNDAGAFTDVNGKTRKITFVQKDDGYDPAKTVPLVDEMINAEKVFGLVTAGSPNTLKVYDKLNQRCVPNLFNQTGHPAWADPKFHPWTSGYALSYTSEAGLWGKFIDSHINEFPNGITVAALIVSSDFGKIYDVGFRSWLDSTPNKDKIHLVTEQVDPQAPTITNQMTTLAAKKPDVFIGMVLGTLCTQTAQEAAKNGMKEQTKYLFQPDTCAGSTPLSKAKVGGDGSVSQDWWIVNGGAKDIRDPSQANDPAVAWARSLAKAHGDDPDAAAELGLGMIHGWPWVQVLQIAGQLDGGLTRANVILAARTFDMNNPFQLPGIVSHTNGNTDAFFTEGGLFQQYDVGKQSYVDRSALFNLDGQSKSCHFNQAAGTCELY